MYILAFDEYGTFEEVQDNQTKYIAGVLYEGSRYDTEVERKRILSYLRSACAVASAEFPEDLHQNHERSNWDQVAAVEKEVRRTISEFVQKGTLYGNALTDENGNDFPGRKGHYDIFAMVKSNHGKPDLIEYGTDPIVNDMVASNLYVHMAEDLISTLLFHNPLVGELKDVRLELASRSLPGGALTAKKKKEYRELGIEDAGDGYQAFYRAANTDTYRTVLQREMRRIGKVDQDISLDVLSINYNRPDPRMAFLYLADFICGFLHTKPKVTDGARVNYAYSKAKEISGREPLVFGYDAADVEFAKAWQYLEMGMFYEALSTGYEGCCGEGAFEKFYFDKWLPRIEQEIIKKKDAYALRIAVRKLESSTFSTLINQEKLLFIFSALERCCVAANADRPDSRMMYKLYNSGIAAYNHIGDSANAAACFEKCLSYVDGAYVDEFIRTRNRLAVSYCDSFAFGKAADITQDTIVYAELLRENRNMILGEAQDNGLLFGITHSQYGQILSYLRNPDAEEHFMTALREMDEGSANYYITLSYLLHHYIDMGNREKYEGWAGRYFGLEVCPGVNVRNGAEHHQRTDYLGTDYLGTDYLGMEESRQMTGGMAARDSSCFGSRQSLRKQYEYLCSPESPSHPKYALYVYVKALWTFYREEVPDGVKAAFADIEADFTKRGLSGVLGGDPWELIYKYLLLFAKRWGDYKGEKKYRKLLENPVSEREGKAVEFLRRFGLVRYYEECGNRAMTGQKARELCGLMIESGYIGKIQGNNGTGEGNLYEDSGQTDSQDIEVLKEKMDALTMDGVMGILEEKFTYMNC